MNREDAVLMRYEEKKRALRNAELAERLRAERTFAEMLDLLRAVGGLNVRAGQKSASATVF